MRRALLLRGSCLLQHAVVSSLSAWAVLLLVGCASTQLEVGSNDPANPAASSEPLPSVGHALDPDFDPQAIGSAEPDSDSLPSDEHHQQKSHEHGAPKQEGHPPAEGKNAGGEPNAPPAANAHAEHRAPAANADDSKGAGQQWTCTMHPQVLEPKPGKCPICGMKLVPVPAKAAPGGTP